MLTIIVRSATVIAGLVILMALFSAVGTVDTGYRGVVVKLGNPTGEIKEQGFYVKTPFIIDVVPMNVQVQKEESDATAASKDLQDVTTKVALNYHLDPGKVGSVYQDFRQDYSVRYISPAVQEAVKSSTAQYTAEELITKRSEVKQIIVNNLRDKLVPKGFVIDDLNIINFSFSQSFNAAIEAKVTAEQNALAAKNKLDQVKYEAQQQIETAKGRAEAISIESKALTEQPQYIELKKIEKWDGRFPQYMGGGVTPFVDIAK